MPRPKKLKTEMQNLDLHKPTAASLSREEQKRRVHLLSEQRRREMIQEGITGVYAELPDSYKTHRRMSKAIILHSAADYLNTLIVQDANLTKELLCLQEEYMELQKLVALKQKNQLDGPLSENQGNFSNSRERNIQMK